MNKYDNTKPPLKPNIVPTGREKPLSISEYVKKMHNNNVENCYLHKIVKNYSESFPLRIFYE